MQCLLCAPRWDSVGGEGNTFRRLTCLSPDGQVLILLDIQHNLQPVAHAALFGFPGRVLVAVEGVALPVSSVHLDEKRLPSGTPYK